MNPDETIAVVLAQPGPQGGGLEGILPLVLILGVFYFLLIRPQQKRAREHKELVAGLKKNDQVITAGGLYGRIVEAGEKIVTLEIAPNVQVRHERSQIGAIATDGKRQSSTKEGK